MMSKVGGCIVHPQETLTFETWVLVIAVTETLDMGKHASVEVFEVGSELSLVEVTDPDAAAAAAAAACNQAWTWDQRWHQLQVAPVEAVEVAKVDPLQAEAEATVEAGEVEKAKSLVLETTVAWFQALVSEETVALPLDSGATVLIDDQVVEAKMALASHQTLAVKPVESLIVLISHEACFQTESKALDQEEAQ